MLPTRPLPRACCPRVHCHVAAPIFPFYGSRRHHRLQAERRVLSACVSVSVPGGFTGSYIFSQTLFTFRTGTTSRACGIFVAASQYLLFLAPVAIVSYVPKLFFGAVLTFIAADLMSDWLYHSRSKVHPIEYIVILLTFLFINLFGLEIGMCAGVVFSMVTFIYDYARVPVVQRVKLRSNVIRSLPLSAMLAESQDQLITLRCRGYTVFGSTI